MSTPHAAAVWEKHTDDETQTAYYYNTRTGESSWEEPEGFVDASADSASSDTAGAASEPVKPPRWRRYTDDNNGKPYYYDEANDITQWEEPEGEIRDASEDEDGGDDDTDADEAEKMNKGDDAPEEAEEDRVASATEREDECGDEEVPATKSEATVADSTAPAAHNWVKHLDKATRKPYYHDTVTNQTQWEEPEQYTEAGTSAVSTEYLEYLHRSRAEKLVRATQRVLDPQGNLSRLNALLSKIGGAGAAASADEIDKPEDIEQGLKERTRAEWQQHVDPHSQRYYYHNIVTGETQWQKPDAPIVSALADWIPPETPDPDAKTGPARTVSGHHYAATAKFNSLSGRFEKLGGEEYFETRGVAGDREGRQMSHFFDVQQLEKNREEAKRIKEQLKRKNIDWKKVAAEKKARKQKRQNEWIYQD